MISNVRDTRRTVTIDIETFHNLDLIQENSGAQKMWILRQLVRKEVERLGLKKAAMEVKARK